MKLTIKHLSTAIFLAFFSLLIVNPASAQKPGMTTPRPPVTKSANNQAAKTAPNPAPAPNIPYCDALMSDLSKKLGASANAECTTQRVACDCKDRKSGLVLRGYVCVQPTTTKCRPIRIGFPTLTGGSPAADRNTNPQKANDPTMLQPFAWSPDILQSTCVRSGTSLEVLLPNHDLAGCDKDNFSIAWELDGKAAGNGRRVECVCGKTMKVTVTELKTKRTSVQLIELNACPGGAND